MITFIEDSSQTHVPRLLLRNKLDSLVDDEKNLLDFFRQEDGLLSIHTDITD